MKLFVEDNFTAIIIFFIFLFRHLVAVVKAWVECSDSDSDSEDERPLSITNEHGTSRLPSNYNESQAPTLRIHMPDTGHVIVNSAYDNMDRLQNVLTGSALFLGKLQHRKKNPKFNFEKYISYLDKVSRNVGFSIGVVPVTWELVSTLFFFLISLIALFVQESIFGKAKSTITIWNYLNLSFVPAELSRNDNIYLNNNIDDDDDNNDNNNEGKMTKK